LRALLAVVWLQVVGRFIRHAQKFLFLVTALSPLASITQIYPSEPCTTQPSDVTVVVFRTSRQFQYSAAGVMTSLLSHKNRHKLPHRKPFSLLSPVFSPFISSFLMTFCLTKHSALFRHSFTVSIVAVIVRDIRVSPRATRTPYFHGNCRLDRYV
jgi:hypothetical protein